MNIGITAVPNFEEAASLAAEFISGIDNLPSEVQHLLQEIRLKEERCQELHQEIAKDQARYIKASLKNNQIIIPPTAALNGSAKSRNSSPSFGTGPKAHLPGRIAGHYGEIESLTNEKIVLSKRIIELITRTRARLDYDLSKVRVLQGEPQDEPRHPVLSADQPLLASSPYGGKLSDSVQLAPIVPIGENLRKIMLPLPEAPPVASTGPGYNKKRKLTTTTSIKLSSPGPPAIPSSQSRSRASRQTQSRLQQQLDEDLDRDAEGEEDMDAEDAEEDSTPYCTCQKPSFGDMIGCDNPDCPFQWFHITCVGVKPPLPDKWYCDECSKHIGNSEKRKGRKK